MAYRAFVGGGPQMSRMTARFGDSGARAARDRVPRTSGATWVAPSGVAVLTVERQDWETGPSFSGDVAIVTDGTAAVATDATLYYREDLVRALRSAGVTPRGISPGYLILAAYRAWGLRCAEHLEGDFAFILWDDATRRGFGARDFGGKRPLYFADLGQSFAAASSIETLGELPGCRMELDYASIAADAAGLFAASGETGYRGIASLRAGSSLEWRRGVTRVDAHWDPPAVRDDAAVSFEEGAEELRRLLSRATVERMPADGPTSVWLSGGWDSTAVFASGELALRTRDRAEHLRPVSISFPTDDPGHEDELIAAAARHWGSAVHWLDIGDIPLFDRPMARARQRGDPFAHGFESGNRALAAGSRAVGARVALDGVGGDQLFQVSNVYMADLFWTGQWGALRREWRDTGMAGAGFREFFRTAVQPRLPHPVAELAGLLRGTHPLRHYLERGPPGWLAPRFVREHQLVAAERRAVASRSNTRGLDAAGYETHWYLTYPYFPRVFSATASIALAEGVELRSPLYDGRVLQFAATRPRAERSTGRETKRLLRQSMRGILPDDVLAPRPGRTGLASGYFDRGMRRTHAAFLGSLIRPDMCLAEAGIVDPAALQRGWDRYLSDGAGDLAVNLFFTLQAEMWLRTRQDGAAAAPVGCHDVVAAAFASTPPGRAARHIPYVQEGTCST